jgi:hypothetical protein
MKKMTFTLLTASVLLSQAAIAQFNPTASNMPTNASLYGKVDSTLLCDTNSVYPNLHSATAASWSLSGLVYQTNADVTTHLSVPTGSPFTAAGYRDSLPGSLSNQYYSVKSNGIFSYGVHLDGFSMPVGTTAGDSLKTPTQDIVFATPQKILAFPAPVGTTWVNIGSANLNSSLTFSPFYTNAPVMQKAYVTEIDSVTGYGNMSVKTATGGMSSAFPVLQLKRITYTVDSFFLNGTPAPSILLSQIGATQGQVDTTYEMVFYRANEVTPLATITFKNATYDTANGGTIHAQRLTLGVNPTTLSNDGINVYPNPMTGNTLHVSLGEGKAGNWSYEVMDMNGKVVANSTLNLSATDKTADITLATTLTKGIYFVSLINNGTVVTVKPISIEN